MQTPQLLLLGSDLRLRSLLEPVVAAGKWLLRSPSDLAECLAWLPRGEPSVVVLRLGRDLEAELLALEQIHSRYPDTAVVVVGDTDQPGLAGLAWDFGARFVLFPPLPRELLLDVVGGLMRTQP